MNVKQLKKTLEGIDESRIVILQKDVEGNSYSPCAGVDGDNAIYVADSTWSGDIKYQKLTPTMKKQGYSDSDVSMEGKPAFVLWPIN